MSRFESVEDLEAYEARRDRYYENMADDERLAEEKGEYE